MSKPPPKKALIPPKVAVPLPSQSDFFAGPPTGSSVPVGATATRGPYTSASSIAAAPKASASLLAPPPAAPGRVRPPSRAQSRQGSAVSMGSSATSVAPSSNTPSPAPPTQGDPTNPAPDPNPSGMDVDMPESLGVEVDKVSAVRLIGAAEHVDDDFDRVHRSLSHYLDNCPIAHCCTLHCRLSLRKPHYLGLYDDRPRFLSMICLSR